MKRLAVVGHPIAHSRSPAIHNAAFAELGLSDEWRYEPIDVPPQELASHVASMPGDGFVGANVTVPHKHAALELADEASEVASAIGAANTLSFDRGAVRADNTDATGFLAALPEPPSGRRALVLGAGGAARAVVWALTNGGASVDVWNRTHGRAKRLSEDFGAAPLPSPASAEKGLDVHGYDLIVNSTSVGMGVSRPSQPSADLKALRMDADVFHDRQVVVDLAYGPDETQLVRAAKDRGATVVDGLEVLVRQGAESFRIWTDLDPPLEAMRTAARQE